MKYPDITITRIINQPYYRNLDGLGPLSFQDQIHNIQLEQLRAMQYDKMKNDKMKNDDIEGYDISSKIEQREEQ